ncbi:cyclic nucleotide-binding domain-containing protein [Candidatus Saccharibacteria bacterium]|nr:cyclic nucleotide-binding domain-containing protein [Candidatus Saccharibacteria bacterium]NIW79753.1 cyclic nucleotide-binding domain-containing protein [Calditrichia bacterium]
MDSFWSNIFKERTKEERGIYDILRNVPLFEDLTKKELAAVERILYRRQYQAGEVIFHQGDPGLGMYIIEAGTVTVILEPAQQVLAELRDGEFFGELALLDESPRSATVTTQTDCKILGFFQSELFDLLSRNPKLSVKIVMKLARIIGERLKKSNQQMQDLRKEIQTLKKPQQKSLEFNNE